MSRRDLFPRMAMRSVAVLVVALLASCSTEASDPTTPTVSTVTARAPGGNGNGGGGGGGGGSITVTGTTPAQLPKGGTGLGVTVSGSGFEPGSELGFELDQVPSDQIVVRGVAFVDESTLIATVDVSGDAEETFFDVAVRNGPKKKGVGIDLLEVVPEFVIPIIQATVIEGFDDPYVYDAANGLLVGRDDAQGGCGWVYDVDTGTRTCLSVPGLRDPVYPRRVNASGRIVALGYPVGGGGGAVDQVAFVIDWPDPTPTILPLNGWEGVAAYGVNAAGEITGMAARYEQIRGKRWEERKALVRWNSDLTVAAVSAVGNDYTGSRMAISDAGVVSARFNGEYTLWDGQPGTVPVPADDGGLGTLGRAIITADGILLGHTSFGPSAGDRILEWTDPYGTPRILVDRDLSLVHTGTGPTDEDGNVYGRRPEGGSLCISPVGGMSRLVAADGLQEGYAAAGTRGKAFGVSRIPDPEADPGSFGTLNVLVSWDVSGGC